MILAALVVKLSPLVGSNCMILVIQRLGKIRSTAQVGDYRGMNGSKEARVTELKLKGSKEIIETWKHEQS